MRRSSFLDLIGRDILFAPRPSGPPRPSDADERGTCETLFQESRRRLRRRVSIGRRVRSFAASCRDVGLVCV